VERLMTAVFHDLAGVPRVAEDPIAQSEIAAFTRRFEQAQETVAREFGIVKSDLTAVRLQVGNLDQKVSGLDEKVDQLAEDVRGMNDKIDRNQAQIVELLTALVGKDPNES
jgi:predicted  nucleic acid-binding Zn-ribbon protein